MALALGEDHDLAIASVNAPKGTADDDEEAAPAEDAGEEGEEEEGDSEE